MNLTELKQQCELSGGCRSPVYQCGRCPFRQNIIQLSEHRQPPHPGNGALDAVNRYLKAFPDLVAHTDLDDGEHFLAWLWQEGFKIVALDPDDHR